MHQHVVRGWKQRATAELGPFSRSGPAHAASPGPYRWVAWRAMHMLSCRTVRMHHERVSVSRCLSPLLSTRSLVKEVVHLPGPPVRRRGKARRNQQTVTDSFAMSRLPEAPKDLDKEILTAA